MISISNAGADIASTNYFETPNARAGRYFVSWNASTARILVPDSLVGNLNEMSTGRICVISRGKWNGVDALEFMFDDDSDAPYALHLGLGQVDRSIANDGKPFRVTAWTSKGKAGDWKGKYRVVDELPCMEPWGGSEILSSKGKLRR